MSSYSAYWVGIDLGTYNSSAAVKSAPNVVEIIKSSAEKPRMLNFIKQEEQYKEFPSFIAFNRDGSISEVGVNSKERAYEEPEFVVWGVKRLLGKSYTELKEVGELDRFPYRIRPDRNNGQCVVAIGDKSYTPIQLCAEIFKKIKSDAEKQTKKSIDSVVVSVPAYYDPLRVTPIVEAARAARFINVKTIPEPVAAALAYQMEIGVKPTRTLVFDLGAGTLDVTAGFLYRNPDKPDDFRFQVMKNTGDPRLGGMDMDDRVLRLIMEKCELTNITARNIALLRRKAELAKIGLSNETKVEVTFPLDNKEYHCEIDQMELKSALEGKNQEKNLLEECRRQIMAAIYEAGWTTEEIELLIMIGGPTKLPCIHDVFKIIFHSNPLILQQLADFYSGKEKVDRMTAVSIGAVMSIDRSVDDKVPFGYGIEDIEFGMEDMSYVPRIIVPRDSPYPFKSQQYRIEWLTFTGLYDFKIIQHIPKSEVEQSGYEYRFVGIQKFAVKNPGNSMVILQMGYNTNKELEVTIKNASSNESVTYVGINQSASIGMNYPMVIKVRSDVSRSSAKKVAPSADVIDQFAKWVRVTMGFIRRKIDNYPIPQMLLVQALDELERLLKKEDVAADFEQIYTKMNGLFWNSNCRGLLSQNEYNELTKRLAEFESELFRIE